MAYQGRGKNGIGNESQAHLPVHTAPRELSSPVLSFRVLYVHRDHVA